VVPLGQPFLRPGVPAATSPEPSIGRRFSSSRTRPNLAVFGGEDIDRDLGEFRRHIGKGAGELARCKAPTRRWPVRIWVSRKTRCVVPAAVEQIHDGLETAASRSRSCEIR